MKPVPTTTTALARDLGISKFVSRNAKSEQPYATLLEIFAEFMYNKYGKEESAAAGASASSTGVTSKPSLDRISSGSKSSSLSKSRNDDDDEGLSRSFAKSAISSRPNSSMMTPSLSSPTSSLLRSDRPISSGPSSVIGSAFSMRPGSASRTGREEPPRPLAAPSAGSRSSKHSNDLMLEEDIDFDEEDEQFDARLNSGSRSKASPAGGAAGQSSQGSFPFPTTPLPSSTPLSLEQAHRAKSLIFGSSHLTGTFTDPWLSQGFYFKPAEVTRTVPSLACGLVQAQGGPCGMLAVVQAYVLRELLFVGSNARATPQQRYALLAASPDALKRALISACAEILWLVGDGRRARVCTRNPSATKMPSARRMADGGTFRPDGVTEALNVTELDSKEALRHFFQLHHATFAAPKGPGVVLFLYSVILTRGVENIEKDRVRREQIGAACRRASCLEVCSRTLTCPALVDMLCSSPSRQDEQSSLIGAHSYCTQEMVNLALTGRARSNVFDGTKDFDGLVLRGIDQRSSIGFLSLFEHYENILVGSYFKQPVYPIWVICSESHYTVAWALETDATTTLPPSGIFDLMYYDELANQKEEIRLTVDTSKRGPPPKDGDLEPPINGQTREKDGTRDAPYTAASTRV